MPSAQLIEEIVRKVLAEQGVKTADSGAEGPVCLILSRRDKADPQVLAKALPQGGRQVFLDTESLPPAGTYDRILLPCLSLKAMADLALGRASGKTALRVLDLLMKGHRIEVLAYEYEDFQETAPPALFDLYAGYEKTLEGFGLCRCRPVTGGGKIIRQGLLTEAAVAELAARGITRVNTAPGCLVTSLARDLAREKGIRINTGPRAGKGN